MTQQTPESMFELALRLKESGLGQMRKVEKNRARLRKFPLYHRILAFYRYNFIRRRISLHQRAMFFFVSHMMGAMSRARAMQRSQRGQK